MNCKTCGGEVNPIYDEYEGLSYIVMWWCGECDEEVFPEEDEKEEGEDES